MGKDERWQKAELGFKVASVVSGLELIFSFNRIKLDLD